MKIVKGTFYEVRYSYCEGFVTKPIEGYIINNEVGIYQKPWGSYNPVDLKSGLSVICMCDYHEYKCCGRAFVNLMNAYKYYLRMKGQIRKRKEAEE